MRSELIDGRHLARRAVIYIRQSTPHQVLTNQESLRLQYDLRRRALDLSSNSVVGQRMAVSLGVELSNRFVDGAVEVIRTVERLMSEVMPLQVAPETLDVVQLRSIVRQPLDGEPVGALGLDGSWPRRDRFLQRLEPTRHEGAAPEPHRILAHPEGLGNLAAGPARQGEQNRPRSVRFAPIPRVAQSDQRRSLFCVCPNRGFARHDPSLKSDQTMESRPASVGQPDHTCLGRVLN